MLSRVCTYRYANQSTIPSSTGLIIRRKKERGVHVFSGEDYGPFVGGFQSLRLLYFQLKMQMTHCCLSQCSQSWWSSLQWKQSSLGIACASSLFFFFMDEVVHCFIHHLPLQFFFQIDAQEYVRISFLLSGKAQKCWRRQHNCISSIGHSLVPCFLYYKRA